MRGDELRSGVHEIGYEAALRVEDLRAGGDSEDDRLPVRAVAVRALPVTAALRPEPVLRGEGGKVPQVGVREEDDVAPLAAVTSVRAAFGDVLLAPEADCAVAAAAGRDMDAGPVVKHELLPFGQEFDQKKP
jgi:hypothetical protein